MPMFIITIKIPYEAIQSPNDYHKIIHTIFHKPTDKVPTPIFRVIHEDFDGITLNVYNDNVPTSKYVIESKECTPEYIKSITINNELNIAFNYAAIKQVNGKCISFNKNTESAEICKKVSAILLKNGCSISKITYNHSGIMNDMEHFNKFPYGNVNAHVTITDYDAFIQLLIHGIGRKKYLGFGYIYATKEDVQ